MPTEVKQRKKSQKLTDEVSETSSVNGKKDVQKEKMEAGKNNTQTALDFRTISCLLSLAVCGLLSWVVVHQNERFSQIEEKYRFLHGKTSDLFSMEEEVLKVSRKCEGTQPMLERLGGQRGAAHPQLEALEQDMIRLKEWASGLSLKREQLESSLSTLRDAVAQIEERTAAITKDLSNKVASVRTDVRRMDGLRSELDSLLVQVQVLEDKADQVEKGMVKRIGEVLANSIDRVTNVRAASQRNTQSIEQLRRRIPELAAADKQMSERLLELESGRARLIRTLTFASDLKPKVATIKRDFGAFEPQLTDLVVRIGRLADDLRKRQREIAELRQTLANLTAVQGDLSVTAKQVSDMGEMRGSS